MGGWDPENSGGSITIDPPCMKNGKGGEPKIPDCDKTARAKNSGKRVKGKKEGGLPIVTSRVPEKGI